MADTIFSKISEELVAQILSRLPSKSLMRFKCVRKSWYVLIKNPNFAAMHLSNSTKNNLSSPSTTILFRRFVLKDINIDTKEILLSFFDLYHDHIDDDMDGDDHLHSDVKDLDVPRSLGLKIRGNFNRVTGLEISSHCDGIVCLTDYLKNVALCNPAIKEFKLLPESEIVLSSPQEFKIAGVGFGFDLKYSRSYKVVRLVYCGEERCDSDRYIVNPPRAEVYALGTDSWKETEIGNIVTKTGFFWPTCSVSIYCKGVVYWCAVDQDKEYVLNYTDDDHDYGDDGDDEDYNENHNNHRNHDNEEPKVIKAGLLSFDMSDEAFHIIPYPPDVGYYGHKAFGVWNESIALLTNVTNPDFVDIWIMDHDINGGVKGSWTKYLAFEPEVPLVPLALWKSSDQVYLVANDGCVVIFYNLSTRKFKYLPIAGVRIDLIQAVVCVKSILSVHGRQQT